jgi:hypothetical protein
MNTRSFFSDGLHGQLGLRVKVPSSSLRALRAIALLAAALDVFVVLPSRRLPTASLDDTGSGPTRSGVPDWLL